MENFWGKVSFVKSTEKAPQTYSDKIYSEHIQ